MKCAYCNRAPDEIEEYIDASAEFNMMPDEYVKSEEGTFNPDTQTFACTECYIKIGMPASALSQGWKAP